MDKITKYWKHSNNGMLIKSVEYISSMITKIPVYYFDAFGNSIEDISIYSRKKTEPNVLVELVGFMEITENHYDKNRRQYAIKWFDNLGLDDMMKEHYAQSHYNKTYTSLTGREIQEIYIREHRKPFNLD